MRGQCAGADALGSFERGAKAVATMQQRMSFGTLQCTKDVLGENASNSN
jgi:hypothetical protein